MRWAEKAKHVKKCAIYQARIKSHVFLDLTLSDHKNEFIELRKILISKHLASGKKIEYFNDRVVFAGISKEKKIEVLRVPVDSGKNTTYVSHVICMFQIQLCVKQKKCISEIERIK